MTTLTGEQRKRLDALETCIDGYEGVFRKLRRAGNLEKYLSKTGSQADELILTGPLLRSIIEQVLSFPPGAYLEQLGKSGKKPDFTPDDVLAHPFVLDAKSSDENLAKHEPQIRAYMEQRRLVFGILFNLREFRVYRAHEQGHDEALSFHVLPLWQLVRGEALPTASELSVQPARVSTVRTPLTRSREAGKELRSASACARACPRACPHRCRGARADAPPDRTRDHRGQP